MAPVRVRALLLSALMMVALLDAPAEAGGAVRYQGHSVKTPTSWFNVWFSTPGSVEAVRGGGEHLGGGAGLEGSPLGQEEDPLRPISGPAVDAPSPPPPTPPSALRYGYQPPTRPRPRPPPPPRPTAPAPQFGYGQYNGPDTWALDYPECAGSRQSPIDFDSRSMLYLEVPEPLRWDDYWRRPANMTLTNTGHTLQVTGEWTRGVPRLSDGPLPGDYAFEQLHFHWGPDDTQGSEHTVHNVSFPLELHAVHYKTEYGDADTAQHFPDGLVVVAYLFRVRRASNRVLEPLLAASRLVPGRSLSTPIRPFPLEDLLHDFEGDYVMYEGSLTTPPCREAVTWLVSARPLSISRDQLEVLRRVEGTDGPIERNFRPVQPSNGRDVYYVS